MNKRVTQRQLHIRFPCEKHVAAAPFDLALDCNKTGPGFACSDCAAITYLYQKQILLVSLQRYQVNGNTYHGHLSFHIRELKIVESMRKVSIRGFWKSGLARLLFHEFVSL